MLSVPAPISIASAFSNKVAAEVTRLISNFDFQMEPPHVGCYKII